uniref:Uncharacterized protein n=1 Tax=Panagrolaimus sp. PS1159 TaxID=55785 RepID=A0AC35GA98_9BILA
MQLASVFPELLNVQICDVSAVLPFNQTSIPGVVENDQSLFYQVPANLSIGLTIKLDIKEGDAIIYVSLTSRLPSSADYDFVANATENNPGHIYISPNQLQNAQSSSFIFISDFVKLVTMKDMKMALMETIVF